MAEMEPLDQAAQGCVESLTECAMVCTEAVTHCLQMGGRHAELMHINLLLDCAQICSTATPMLLRRSEFSEQVTALCADVCDACAESCDQLSDDDWMRDCAEVCRNCAASCREFVSAIGGEEELAA